ncbi:LysR family transcriptional regulator [Paraburkholderia tropica]|uniref:LysR family transcriptional regulator n=1 Tax=Paraburkholderia tropica TaxID=92647 RepID=UPI002AB282D4|nr:LysR family transcriptional regulator [Paraburkholderia tropica]
MRFNKLDLNLLVALDALLSERNISRAAEKVNLSQPAMSNALGRLREYFEDDLLLMVGRKMEPTSRALGLEDTVREILVRVGATVTKRSSFVPAESTRLFRLVVSDYTQMTLMPHVIKRAYELAPGVRFELCAQSAHPQRALERTDVDLLIIPKEYCSNEHPSETLLEETFCCVIWKDSLLAAEELTHKRYLEAGHIVVVPGQEQTGLEEWFMRELGVARRIETTTYSFTAPGYLLVGTERIATMHRRLALQAAKSEPIVIRDVPLAMPKMQQSTQWHTHRTNDPGLLWLRELLMSCASAL